jgi:AraC-like DNA-binding protein
MSLTGNPSASVEFSTEDFPLRERLDAFREVTRSVGNFEVEAIGDEFAFSAYSVALPGLAVAHVASSAVRVERTREMAADDTRDLTVAVVHSGTVAAAQRGREVTLESGAAYLFSTHDPLLVQRSARVTNYSLLRSELAPAVSRLDDVIMTAIPPNSESIRLLTGYTDLLFKNGAPQSAEYRRLAISHIHDLIVLAIGATREAAETAKSRGLGAARRADLHARAQRLIALRFDDPDLAPDEIAHRLGVSSRLLQKVFAERGETVMTRLWDERVNRAARLVSAPEAADRSITDIAFACGFNDSSHFGRMFAARMGMPPSRWRKQAREHAATEDIATERRAKRA